MAAVKKMKTWVDEAGAILRETKRLQVERDVPMSSRTSLGVGGPASILVLPEEPDDLAMVLARFAAAEVPFDFLGAGSNILVADSGPSFVVVAAEALSRPPAIEKERVHVGAGFPVPRLIKRLTRAGLSGLEFAEGIPGSVGGCVRMNAGWHEGAFGQAVESVTTVSRLGVVETIACNTRTFDYRSSPGLGERFVTGVTLRLTPDSPERIAVKVREYHDHRVRTQPTGARNAGCIFKNPPGDHAGRLIDSSGLKGHAVGRAVVSDMHANFIINRGGATSTDVSALIEVVREKVQRDSGVMLEREVILWA